MGVVSPPTLSVTIACTNRLPFVFTSVKPPRWQRSSYSRLENLGERNAVHFVLRRFLPWRFGYMCKGKLLNSFTARSFRIVILPPSLPTTCTKCLDLGYVSRNMLFHEINVTKWVFPPPYLHQNTRPVKTALAEGAWWIFEAQQILMRY